MPDIDPLSGETLDEVTRQAVARLQQALDEAAEARRPAVLLQAAALSLGAVAAGVLALWAISRFRGAAKRTIGHVAEKTVAKTGLGDAAVLRRDACASSLNVASPTAWPCCCSWLWSTSC